MMNYIIVQAGGKGTRLGGLTQNKPKALVPVDNLPMLFHLFKKFPDKYFVIIADYKKEVMHEYLESFAGVKYCIVDANGMGTCAGIRQAIEFIPEQEPFLLIWSDLILPTGLELPEEYWTQEADFRPKKDYIGISKTFPCRWTYLDGKFQEERSYEHGVAGFFLFAEKDRIRAVPESGELVRWMQERGLTFEECSLAGTKEFGLIEEYNKLEPRKCRPFNRITYQSDRVIKEGIDDQGRRLAEKECAWYEKAKKIDVSVLPQIYGTNPLEMERIRGKNIYECHLPYEEKRKVLQKLVDELKLLHRKEQIPTDLFSCREAYYNKTIQRIKKIRDLVPLADREHIVVNGKTCRNIFFYKRALEKKIEKLVCDKFCFIHGDCTFSNLMLREDGNPVLIDPRGYFGYTDLYGDPLYDWAKLYYSIVGNYDQFNLKNFCLEITDKEIRLDIASNGWEDMEDVFFEMTETKPEEIRLLHAVIWLSLTTYAWQDYDSVCGAFYNGLYYLEDVL